MAELGLAQCQPAEIQRSSKVIGATNIGNWSTKEYLPMGLLENTEAGSNLFWQIEHNGSWHWEISDQMGSFYIQLSGPSETESHWWKNLQPGETFTTVPVCVGSTIGKFDDAMGELTKYRRVIRRKNDDNEKLCIIFNDYMNCLWANPTTAKELPLIDAAHKAGCEYFIEVPQERIPGIQRLLIKKCILAKKPVIVATQMLHTMINNPRPTRAEVTDIANAIYYRTDALMLSGETAYGKYPVEAVKTMAKIAAQAEKDKLAENDIRIPLDENSNDVTAFLAKQAVKATSKLNIRAIITDSFSGRTARNIAAFRGKYPVLAICYKEKTMRHLALSYGVEAIYMPEKANGQAYYFAALRKLLDDGVLSESDMVAYLSSGKQGTQTSFLEINVVGDVLKYAMDYVLPNRNRYL